MLKAFTTSFFVKEKTNEKINIDKKEVLEVRDTISTIGEVKSDLILLGCPHHSINEIRETSDIARNSEKVSKDQQLGWLHVLPRRGRPRRQAGDGSRASGRTDLAVGGRDLIGMGLQPGPIFSEILHILLERVLDDPSLNTRESLLPLAAAAAQSRGCKVYPSSDARADDSNGKNR